jgi:hypothetical protein
MKRRSVAVAWLLAAGCARCGGAPAASGRGVTLTADAGAEAELARPAIPDAGQPPPYVRRVRKLPSLPRQARLAQIFIGDSHSQMPWNPPRARKRSREEAKALAERIAAELRHGADFDDLARRESEWPLAAREGGSLGIVTEGESGMLPIVDPTVFTMPVGEVTAPFESPIGFHVLKKLPMVRIAHILIAVHDGKNGIEARTRDEARALAASVETQLKGGKPFDVLAFDLSDDLGSAGRGGDLGGIDEHTALAPDVRAAAKALPPGQVSSPIEVPQGFEILQRSE